MTEIERLFAEQFRPWGLVLPEGATERGEPGDTEGAGWSVRYVWGDDDRGRYLDYVADHRMTNQRHVRLRETGETESLPAVHDGYVSDGTEADRRRAEAEYVARNRRVYAALRRKGLAG